MSLRDDIVQVGDENPHLIPDLLPIIAKAVGVKSSCCRKASVAPAPDKVLRGALIRLAHDKPETRPYLLPIILRYGEEPTTARKSRR